MATSRSKAAAVLHPTNCTWLTPPRALQALPIYEQRSSLLRRLVPHLPIDPSQQDEVRHCVEGCLEAEYARNRRSMEVLCDVADAQLAKEAREAAAEQAANVPRPRRPPLSPEGRQLAERRARALALLKCANPRCSRLEGASEAAAPRGRLCSGCRTVRFCSEACSQQEWPQHRAACRLLRAPPPNG